MFALSSRGCMQKRSVVGKHRPYQISVFRVSLPRTLNICLNTHNTIRNTSKDAIRKKRENKTIEEY